MAALKKEDLERLEATYGLSVDGLSYQLRCSRIAAVQNGEEWQIPTAPANKKVIPAREAARAHPLWGKTILLTPMMKPDANRNLWFDEPVGHEIEVSEAKAGEMIYNLGEDTTKIFADYVIERENSNKVITAKTHVPRVGTQITITLGKDLVPIVQGNDGSRGYLWSCPTRMFQVDDCMIQIYSLQTLINAVYPEILPKFSGKPMMSYIDSVTLAASIPQTDALLKETRRKERRDAAAGLV